MDNLQIIETEVCDYYQIKFSDIINNRKKRMVIHVLPRNVIMYFIGRYTNLSTADAGAIFGKDHSTFIHAKKSIANQIKFNKYFRNEMFIIESAIEHRILMNEIKNESVDDSQIIETVENLICL